MYIHLVNSFLSIEILRNDFNNILPKAMIEILVMDETKCQTKKNFLK